jgi:hypothetical protein
MAQINLTATARLDFEINEKSSFILSLKCWDKTGAVKTALNFPTAVWRLSIQHADGNIVLTLTEGNGITVVANEITIDRDYIQMQIPNGTYKYDLRGDLPGNNNIYPLEGEIKIKKRITQPA